MTKKSTASTSKKVLKDPQGGLTRAGRAHFKETEGANLKPGVKGAADTPEKMKRKGSFLRRHFANPNPGPLQDEQGKPTRRALSAHAWGEPVPKSAADVKKLAAKGTALLEKYHEATDGKKKVPASKGKPAAARKKSTPAKIGSTAKKIREINRGQKQPTFGAQPDGGNQSEETGGRSGFVRENNDQDASHQKGGKSETRRNLHQAGPA